MIAKKFYLTKTESILSKSIVILANPILLIKQNKEDIVLLLFSFWVQTNRIRLSLYDIIFFENLWNKILSSYQL
jgi:hypothetical protein